MGVGYALIMGDLINTNKYNCKTSSPIPKNLKFISYDFDLQYYLPVIFKVVYYIFENLIHLI